MRKTAKLIGSKARLQVRNTAIGKNPDPMKSAFQTESVNAHIENTAIIAINQAFTKTRV
jgi:hypothetical protein